MKHIKLLILALTIVFSSVIVLERPNIIEKYNLAQNIEFTIQDDYNFDLLSSNSTWTENTIDRNSNGLIDVLNIELAVNTTVDLIIYGILKDPTGNWLGYTQNETYSSLGEQDIILSFPGHTIYAGGYSGAYSLSLTIEDPDSSPSGMNFRNMYTTNIYNYSQFERPTAVLTGDVTDYGVDTDNDSLYNEIHIEFSVNISEAGMYLAAVMLNSADPLNESNRQYTGGGFADLPVGDNQTITAIVPTPAFYIEKLNGPYSLGFVYLVEASAEINFQQFKQHFGFTQAYNYSQFDPAPAFFTGNIYDSQIDNEGDSKFEGIEILVELNVSVAGDYMVDIEYQIVNNTEYRENRSYYAIGTHNVSFFIQDTQIYLHKLNGSIIIERLTLVDSNYETIQNLFPSYYSSSYLYTNYNPPGLLLTGRFFDMGINTDNNSFFDELKISVEVNVTQNDTFMCDMSLTGPVNMWTSNTTYLEQGIQNISFSFFVNELYQHQINTSFVVNYLSILVDDMGQHKEIYFGTDIYTTRIYNFTEFDRPSILFTLNFWDYGLDLNNNTFYDVLVVETEVEVFEANTFTFYANIKSNTSPISYFYYSNFQQYLDPGTHIVSFVFDDVQQLDCTFHLNMVTVRDEAFQVIGQISDPYDTDYYSYNDFEHTTVSIGNIMDYSYSETNESYADSIIIEFDLTFSQDVQNHRVEVTMEATNLEIGFGQAILGNFHAGMQRIEVEIDTENIVEPYWETAFVVSIRVLDSNSDEIFEAHNYYTTRTYSYTEFIQITTTTTTTTTTTITTELPEDTTTTDNDDTTSRPSLTPSFTALFSLGAVVAIPLLRKRGR